MSNQQTSAQYMSKQYMALCPQYLWPCASRWSSRPAEDNKFCAINFEKKFVLSNFDAASHWISAYLKDKNVLSNLETSSHWINASLKTFVCICHHILSMEAYFRACASKFFHGKMCAILEVIVGWFFEI